MYTCIVIDDERSTVELLSDYINQHNNLQLANTFSDPLVALNEIKNLSKPVDIIFIDIEMPKLSGIDLAVLIKHKTHKLVFITAHTKYAFDSYELDADGYLLKPFSQMKFAQTVEKMIGRAQTPAKAPVETKDFILVKSKEQKTLFIRINISNIIAIESQDKDVKIYMADEVVLARSSLSGVMNLLQGSSNFVQIHKSFVVSQYHIKGIERWYVLMDTDLKFPIGRSYRDFYHKISDGR